MGSKQSYGLNNALNINNNRDNTIQIKYYKQVFTQHKMSSLQFKQRLWSIKKRSTYLQYKWARELEEFIKLSNKDQLYADYKSTLKQNCYREGRREKLFCPKSLRKSFLKELALKTENYDKNLSFQQLIRIVQQCKAFLMVNYWLYQLVSLKKEIQNQNENQTKIISLYDENKKVFETLIILAEKYYKQLFKSRRASVVVKVPNKNIRQLVFSLQNTRNYHDRQPIIMNLLKVLQNDKENSQLNFFGVCQLLGKQNVASHLFLIHQIGTYQSSITQKYLKWCLSDNQDSESIGNVNPS